MHHFLKVVSHEVHLLAHLKLYFIHFMLDARKSVPEPHLDFVPLILSLCGAFFNRTSVVGQVQILHIQHHIIVSVRLVNVVNVRVLVFHKFVFYQAVIRVLALVLDLFEDLLG